MGQRLYHYFNMSVYGAILAWIAYSALTGGPTR